MTGDRIVLHYTEISWGTRTWHQQTTRSTSVKYSAITSTGDVLPSTCLTISQTASVHAWPQYKVRLNCPPDQEEKPEYQQDNVKQSCKQRKKKIKFQVILQSSNAQLLLPPCSVAGSDTAELVRASCLQDSTSCRGAQPWCLAQAGLGYISHSCSSDNCLVWTQILVSFPNQLPSQSHLHMRQALEVILSVASVCKTGANALNEDLRES